MTYQQALIPDTEVPILAGIDCGESGAIAKNRPDGSIELFKTPENLTDYRDILKDCDLIVIERIVPMGVVGNRQVRITDNSVYSQYKELYGYIQGLGLNVHPVVPRSWMKFLGLPKKSKIPEQMWKDFLHSYCLQIFPGRRIPKYQADAMLLFHVARLIHPMERSKWP